MEFIGLLSYSWFLLLVSHVFFLNILERNMNIDWLNIWNKIHLQYICKNNRKKSTVQVKCVLVFIICFSFPSCYFKAVIKLFCGRGYVTDLSLKNNNMLAAEQFCVVECFVNPGVYKTQSSITCFSDTSLNLNNQVHRFGQTAFLLSLFTLFW